MLRLLQLWGRGSGRGGGGGLVGNEEGGAGGGQQVGGVADVVRVGEPHDVRVHLKQIEGGSQLTG